MRVFGKAFPQKYSRSAHCRSHYSLFLHLILPVRFVRRTALWASPLTTSKDLLITNQLLYQLSHSSIFSFMIGFCSATFFEKVLTFRKSLRFLKKLFLTTSKDLLITNQLLFPQKHSRIARLHASHCSLFFHLNTLTLSATGSVNVFRPTEPQ